MMKRDMSSFVSNSLTLFSSTNTSIMDEINNIQTSLLTDNRSIYVLYGDKANYLYEYQISNELDKLRTSNSIITSVLLYNSKINRFVFQPNANFESSQLSQYLIKDKDALSIKMVPWIKDSAWNVVTTNTISFIINANYFVKSDYPAYIVVSTEENMLKEKLKKLALKDQQVMVLDNSGKVLSGTDRYSFLDDISTQRWVQEILHSKDKSGGFFTNINSRNMMVSYVKADYFGWIYISFLPSDFLNKNIETFYCILISSAILLSVFVYGAANITKIIYNPMQRLLMNLNISRNEKRANEFELFERTYHDKVDNINQLENVVQQIKPVLWQAYILSLIEGFSGQSQQKSQILYDIRNMLIGPFYCIIIIRLDRAGNTVDADNLNCNEILFAAGKYSHELCNTEVIIQSDSEAILLLQSKIPSISDEVYHSMDEVQNMIRREFHISLSISIGSVVDSIDQIHETNKAANEFIKYHFFYGPGMILSSKSIDIHSRAPLVYPISLECSLEQDIKAGDLQGLKKHLSDFYKLLARATYDDAIASIRQLCSGMAKSLPEALNCDLPALASLNGKMPDTLDETIAALEKVLSESCLLLSSAEYEPNKLLVKRIHEYIKSNYSNVEMSLTTLAETFGVSTGHISRWFKFYIGIGFNEYLSGLRLEEACKLLNETNYSMAKIIKIIGINNINYFYTLFKKIYGITPSQFREHSYIKKGNG